MRGGVAVALVAIMVVTAGCNGVLDPGNSTAGSPDGATPTVTAPPTTTEGPIMSPMRREELDRWTNLVDNSSIGDGEWEYLTHRVVRITMTPDVDERHKLGASNGPVPEAIAAHMHRHPKIAPDVAIVRVERENGEFLGAFAVEKDVANRYAEYELTPDEFLYELGQTANTTEAWRSEYDPAPVLSYYVDHEQIRTAYLKEFVERLAQNVSSAEEEVVTGGLYDEAYRIPSKGVIIHPNTTVYLSVAFPEGSSSEVLTEAQFIWAQLHEEGYYGTHDPNITLQIRVYNETTGTFRYALHDPSYLVDAYLEGDINKGQYVLEEIRHAVDDIEHLPGVAEHINGTSASGN